MTAIQSLLLTGKPATSNTSRETSASVETTNSQGQSFEDVVNEQRQRSESDPVTTESGNASNTDKDAGSADNKTKQDTDAKDGTDTGTVSNQGTKRIKGKAALAVLDQLVTSGSVQAPTARSPERRFADLAMRLAQVHARGTDNTQTATIKTSKAESENIQKQVAGLHGAQKQQQITGAPTTQAQLASADAVASGKKIANATTQAGVAGLRSDKVDSTVSQPVVNKTPTSGKTATEEAQPQGTQNFGQKLDSSVSADGGQPTEETRKAYVNEPTPSGETAKANQVLKTTSEAIRGVAQNAPTPAQQNVMTQTPATQQATDVGPVTNADVRIGDTSVSTQAALVEEKVETTYDGSARFVQVLTAASVEAVGNNSGINGSSTVNSVAGTDTASPSSGIDGMTNPEDAGPVGRQIANVIRARSQSTDQTITLRLDPPELGRVHISLKMQGGELRAVVRVENPRTFEDMRHEAPALVERLAGSGVRVRQVDVILNNNSTSQQEDGSQQGMFFDDQRQQARQQADNDNDEATHGESSGDTSAETTEESMADQTSGSSHISDDALNVWM